MGAALQVVKVNEKGVLLEEFNSIKAAAIAAGVSQTYVKTRCGHQVRHGIYRKDKDGNWFTFEYRKNFKIK